MSRLVSQPVIPMVMDIEGIDDAQSPTGGRQLRKRMSKVE